MKKLLVPFLIVSLLMVGPALAKKPNSAGNGKISKETHQSEIQAREKYRGVDGDKETAEKVKAENSDKLRQDEGDGAKGLEKQRARKSEQVQKELDKGSEQGQEARQQRRKWWRFWE